MSTASTGAMSPDTDPDLMKSGEGADAVVELPAHASEYHEPRTPPPPTDHQTLERGLVHVGPEGHYPGRLGPAVDRHAPTVQRRAVPRLAGRARRASIGAIAVLAIAGGGLAGWALAPAGPSGAVSGAQAPPEGPRQLEGDPQARAAAAVTAAAPTPPARASEAVAPAARSAPSSGSPAAATSPTGEAKPAVPEGARAAASSSASSPATASARPRSWLSEEAPKAWVR